MDLITHINCRTSWKKEGWVSISAIVNFNIKEGLFLESVFQYNQWHKLEKKDYPLLYQESSNCSIENQKKHFLFVRIQISLLIVIAIVTSFPLNGQINIRNGVVIILLILLITELFVRIWMTQNKFDHYWFSSRAIAESVKSESWRFMMKVEPYDNNLSDSEAKKYFIKRLHEILHRQPSIISKLTSALHNGQQISDNMIKIRKISLEERIEFYIENRIHDQNVWYALKASWNQKRESFWLFISWIMPIAAIIIAIIILNFTNLNTSLIGIITTAGAGAMTWMHSKRFRELSQSYSLTAQDLSLLETRANTDTSETNVAQLVFDVERTISREHSMWLARRQAPHD